MTLPDAEQPTTMSSANNNPDRNRNPNSSSNYMILSGEILLHYEQTRESAKRLLVEIDKTETEFLTQCVPEMIDENRRANRLADLSTLKLRRVINKHVQDLHIIQAKMDEEMFPRLENDFELNPYLPRVTNTTPTRRENNLSQDMFEDPSQNGSDSDRSSAPKCVPLRQPLNEGLKLVSDEDHGISTAKTEIKSQVQNTTSDGGQSHKIKRKGPCPCDVDKPEVTFTSNSLNDNDDVMEILYDNLEGLAASPASTIKEKPCQRSQNINFVRRDCEPRSTTSGAISSSQSQAVVLEFGGQPDLPEEVNKDEEFTPVVVVGSIRTQSTSVNMKSSNDGDGDGPIILNTETVKTTLNMKSSNDGDGDGPIILKTESVRTSSQESDFQSSTPGYSLFTNSDDLDLEILDDEMPATSSRILKNNSNSSSSDLDVIVDRDPYSSGDDDFWANKYPQKSAIQNFIEKDWKLKKNASEVRLEKIPDYQLERFGSRVERPYKPRACKVVTGTIEDDIENALKKQQDKLRGRKVRKVNAEKNEIRKSLRLGMRRSRIPRARPPHDYDSEPEIVSDSEDVDSVDFDNIDDAEEFDTWNDIRIDSFRDSSPEIQDESESNTDTGDEDEDTLSGGEADARNFVLMMDATATPKSVEDSSPVTLPIPRLALAKKRGGGGYYITPKVVSPGDTPPLRRSPRHNPTIESDSSDSEELRKLEIPVRRPVVMSDSDSEDDFKLSGPSQTERAASNVKQASSILSSSLRSNARRRRRSHSGGSSSDLSIFSSDKGSRSRNTRMSLKRKLRSSTSNSSGDERINVRRKLRRFDVNIGSQQDPITLDSSSDSEDSIPIMVRLSERKRSKRKNVRRIMDDHAVSKTTRDAEVEEECRKRRLKQRQIQLSVIAQPSTREVEDTKSHVKSHVENTSQIENTNHVEDLTLDVDTIDLHPIVQVDKSILLKLKPHQRDGLKFMWDTCIESVAGVKERPGTGCIIAHCMGLGKSVQALGFLHTILTHDILNFKSALIVCPMNTITNWNDECNSWLKNTKKTIPMFNLSEDARDDEKCIETLTKWEENGGLGLIHYDRFKKYMKMIDNDNGNDRKSADHGNVVVPGNSKNLELIRRVFFHPGPDIIVYDEGHLLKNQNTKLSIAANRVQTKRRIILTGTPLQNNLKEYYTMVSLVKPNLLGTQSEFNNRFGNPIDQGSHLDSTPPEIAAMRKRSHVLHKMLDGVVQRYDFSVLQPYLPRKYEYTIYVELSDVQKELYKFYTNKKYKDAEEKGEEPTKHVMSMYQGDLSRICSHPSLVLAPRTKSNKRKSRRLRKNDSESNISEFVTATLDPETKTDDDSTDSTGREFSDNEIGWLDDDGNQLHGKNKIKKTVIEPEKPEDPWYKPFKENGTYFDAKNVELSGKLFLVKEILKACELYGDKLLIFSQFLSTLKLIEEMLERWDTERKLECFNGSSGKRWRRNKEYFRLDGNTTLVDRKNSTENFNNGKASKAKVFLISTRAGGLGINLCGANRVVIFDASWNPAQDLQSIFRVYRFGQRKPCYIYRLISHRTLEEKIYNNQVKKLSLAGRVVDEQQIANFFNKEEGKNVYMYDEKDPPEYTSSTTERPTDPLLLDLLKTQQKWIYRYREHDTLLEDRKDEVLTKEEQLTAMAEYEAEKEIKKPGPGRPAKFKVAGPGVGAADADSQSPSSSSTPPETLVGELNDDNVNVTSSAEAEQDSQSRFLGHFM